jgi:hypothetical protein
MKCRLEGARIPMTGILLSRESCLFDQLLLLSNIIFIAKYSNPSRSLVVYLVQYLRNL